MRMFQKIYYWINLQGDNDITREELLVFHRAPPLVADRGMLTRYPGYRGNKIPGADQN